MSLTYIGLLFLVVGLILYFTIAPGLGAVLLVIGLVLLLIGVVLALAGRSRGGV